MNKSDPPKKPPTAGGGRTSQPYPADDPIPVAEVTELDTDTAWDLFEELAEPGTMPKPTPDPFAETVPAELEPKLEHPQPGPPRKSPV